MKATRRVTGKKVRRILAFSAVVFVLAAALHEAAGGEPAPAKQAEKNVQQKPPPEQPAPPGPFLPGLPVEKRKDMNVTDVSVKGTIEGENITFALGFTVELKKNKMEVPLVAGDVVLDVVESPEKGYRLRYDHEKRTYYMSWARRGTYEVAVTFAARPKRLPGDQWRESTFTIPSSNIRKLEVTCDRTDLEVVFPGALRLTRELKDGRLVIAAIQGPGRPFAVRWKPQVAELDAKLVLSSEANTIATVSPGALNMDTLFGFDISQGKLTELTFSVPKSLSISQVRGRHIRDWTLTTALPDDTQTLSVILNRPQTKDYALQVLSEMVLQEFPTKISVPVIEPGGVRAGGFLSIGTNSAIHLVVEKTGGLTQVGEAGFPRIILDRTHPRTAPRGKAFYYMHASIPYQMTLSLDDIVPSYDASERIAINVQEDDLTVDVAIELDVRDAPIRNVIIEVPSGFSVADVAGKQVKKDDYSVVDVEGDASIQEVHVNFVKPLLGRTVVTMRMEIGKGPLGREQRIEKLSVRGAKNERGYVVVVAEKGVRLDTPAVKNLREVHTGSVPMRVANAQYAYRFREKGWSLSLAAEKKPAEIRVEAFHCISLGDGALYGSVVVNYFISGAPVDELHFTVPDRLQNVEFVGSDVSRPTRNGDKWTVKLQRKVIGDYNLAVTYMQRYKDGESILVGGVECDRIETRTGYIALASSRNLRLTPDEKLQTSLLEINRDEIPTNYRLLVSAPMLKTYKYVSAPHNLVLKVDAYERESLLPVVVEVMGLRSRVRVGKDGTAESETLIRFMVKNTSSQFLCVTMPKDARGNPVKPWATRIIESDANGSEKAVRVTASYDKAKGLHMIPLRRNRDPNVPTIVELEYGQEHEKLRWAGKFSLAAPKCRIRCTFANWDLAVQKDWSIIASPDFSGNMSPIERDVSRGDLWSLTSSVGEAWGWALYRGISEQAKFMVGGTALVILLLAFLLWRRALPVVFPAVLLACLLGVGGVAADGLGRVYGTSAENELRTIEFKQVLNVDDETPLALSAFVIPSWRRNAALAEVVMIGAAALVCFVLAASLRRRPKTRRLLAALGIAGSIYTAAQFPDAAVVLAHVFTWGVPALMAAWFGVRVMLMRPVPAHAAATAMLLIAATMFGGCKLSSAIRPVAKGDTLRTAEYTLTAEKDSMAIDIHLSLDIEKPVRFAIVGSNAILLSPERISNAVFVEPEDGQYYVHVKKKGSYDIDLKFLSPLPKAGEDQSRLFKMPVPMALTSRVKLIVPKPGMLIEAPTAIRLTKQEDDKSTTARAILGPGDHILFRWRPRARQVELETTSFIAEISSLIRFDTGLVQGRHRIQFKIRQGELKDIKVRVPDNMTVTSTKGADLGTWRFDPVSHILEARLATPARDLYVLNVVTQITAESTPYEVSVATLTVEQAVRQRGTLGLLTSSSVYLTIKKHPQKMNVDDFSRDSAALIKAISGARAGDVRHAYRTNRADDLLQVQVNEVTPEIRTLENTAFSVEDDRLVLNGELTVNIAKAGMFSIDLKMPDGYDIDSLGAAQVSHWDETTAEGGRIVRVHFKTRLVGQVPLKLALSRPVAGLPTEIPVPRVQVVGTLKHTGKIVFSAERGLRLTVATRKGVSELNPVDLGIRTRGALAFKLLKPDWEMVLNTEVIEARVNVSFLHVARMTDGRVAHTQYLRYSLHNAGSKMLVVKVPAGAVGLEITGPEIARTELTDPDAGLWTVELARKWFDRPYPLRLDYETRYDRAAGEVKLEQAGARDVAMQRGHVVVYATDRMQLAEQTVGQSLQPDDARGIPRKFGAGDLSNAAFCYSSSMPDYELVFTATRHDAADVLEAEVLRTTLLTVVNELGESINRVQMQLRVGSKRHLEVRLPAGATLWALLVNRGSVVPSKRLDKDGAEVLLVPMPQAPSGDVPVEIDMVYAVPRADQWRPEAQAFTGPQFDLPLKNVDWQLYLPEVFDYYDFDGSLTEDEDVVKRKIVQHYNIDAYQSQVRKNKAADLRNAIKLQKRGNDLAEQGFQYEARQALEWAYNYSQSDVALNEDTRVNLRRLKRQQAVVGIVGNRDRLRRQTRGMGAGGKQAPQLDLGDRFNQAQAARLQSSLSKADSDNLGLITDRVIEGQEAAAGTMLQLLINVPIGGRLIRYSRPLMVKSNDDMWVSFKAEKVMRPRDQKGWLCLGGLFVLAFAVISIGSCARRRCVIRPRPARNGIPARPTAEDREDIEESASGGRLPDDEQQNAEGSAEEERKPDENGVEGTD